MEQNQNTSLFSINIDQNGKYHLTEAAKWAKFLAIFGIIICILIAVSGLFFGSIMNFFMRSPEVSQFDEFRQFSTSEARGVSAMVAILYLLIALLYFFPCLFLLRFANKAKAALATNSTDTISSSFQSLKATFRYIGVLTIILICIWVLGIIAGLAGGSSY